MTAPDPLPIGYRWASAIETERYQQDPASVPGVIVVELSTDSYGNKYTNGESDLAVPLTQGPFPTDMISEIHQLVELVEGGALTTNQFYGVVRLVLGIDQRSEESRAIGRLVIAVQRGELPLASLTAALDARAKVLLPALEQAGTGIPRTGGVGNEATR